MLALNRLKCKNLPGKKLKNPTKKRKSKTIERLTFNWDKTSKKEKFKSRLARSSLVKATEEFLLDLIRKRFRRALPRPQDATGMLRKIRIIEISLLSRFELSPIHLRIIKRLFLDSSLFKNLKISSQKNRCASGKDLNKEMRKLNIWHL